MPRSRKPAALEDQLDAALDGLRGPVAAELGPLLEAAEELRTALERPRLDAAVARRHLAQALGPAAAEAVTVPPIELDAAVRDSHETQDARGAEVVAATRAARATRGARGTRASRARCEAGNGRAWRRRAAAFTLAAAAVLTPLVVLSGHTLPGEPLYPVKVTAENARLAVALSPEQRADLRSRYAATRLDELEGLVDDGRIDQIPSAISALDGALAAAQRSLGTTGPRAGTLDQRLRQVRAGQTAELTSLVKRLPSTTPTAARVKIEGAVDRSLSGDR